jgi:NitT/TauT family transport system substrate-binding protein
MRTFVALVLLAALASLTPAPATAQSNPAIRIATNPIDSGAEVFYAKELGLFAKAGLDVQIEPGQNGSAIAASVASNAVDIGYADIGAIAKAHTRKIEFTIIAPAAMWLASAPVNVLMVAKNAPYRTAKDLNGKTIAVPGLGTNAEFAVHAWLDANGADANSVKFIELSYAAMPAALEAGRIDAAHMAEPFIATAKQSARVLASADDALGKEYLRTVWFSNPTWAKQHPDLVARFAAVMSATAKWANNTQNHAKSAAMLVQYTKIDPAVVSTMTRAHYGESLNVALLQPEIDTNAKYSHFTAFPAQELLDPH